MVKKRLRLRTPFRIFLSVIAIILIVTLYFPVRSIINLTRLNYSFFSSVEIYKLDLTDKVLEYDYSEVIDKTISSEDFIIDRLDTYVKLEYYERDNYLDNVNKLISSLAYLIKSLLR